MRIFACPGLALAAVLALVAGSASAQDNQAPANPKQGNTQLVPSTGGVHSGVIRPQVNPDPGVTLPTPSPSKFPTPVIKPPGTRGNPAPVEPK
jgi:hypothetical protein